MKKLYKVITGRTDGCEGKYTYNDEEYVRTADITAYIEAKKTEIENRGYWWMDHTTGADMRPTVTAEEIAVIEA